MESGPTFLEPHSRQFPVEFSFCQLSVQDGVSFESVARKRWGKLLDKFPFPLFWTKKKKQAYDSRKLSLQK